MSLFFFHKKVLHGTVSFPTAYLVKLFSLFYLNSNTLFIPFWENVHCRVIKEVFYNTHVLDRQVMLSFLKFGDAMHKSIKIQEFHSTIILHPLDVI